MFTTGILIPHYNDIAGLKATLESFDYVENLLVLIIDDGSEQDQFPSESFISSINNLSPEQIRVESLGYNQGIETALNHGLEILEKEIKPDYIMRIDSGDTCINGRIKKQIEYLNNHPDICLIGSQVEYVDESGKYLFALNLPLAHKDIQKYIHKAVPFIHSAIMFRTEAITKIGRYTTSYPAAEDYALFFEFVKNCTTANLPETLTRVVWDTNGISVVKRKRQMQSRLKLLWQNAGFDAPSILGILRLVTIMSIPLPLLQLLKTSLRK